MTEVKPLSDEELEAIEDELADSPSFYGHEAQGTGRHNDYYEHVSRLIATIQEMRGNLEHAVHQVGMFKARAEAAEQSNTELKAMLSELASDLEGELIEKYGHTKDAYPSEKRRFERDMAVVYRAKAYMGECEKVEAP